MSIRIDKPTPEDADWTVWLETEPDVDTGICIGNGATRRIAIDDAVDSLIEGLDDLRLARKVKEITGGTGERV